MPTILSSLPTDRDGQAFWLVEQENRIAQVCREATTRIVLGAVNRFVDTIDVIVSAGDLVEIEAIDDAWMTFVHTTFADELGFMHMAGSMTAWQGLAAEPTEAFARQWESVVNHAAESYVHQHIPKLQQVGQRTKNMVRRQVESAVTNGWTNEQLKSKLEDLGRFSEARADTIARTETIGAYVQGDLAGARALGDDGPVEKVWVATLDRRTRPPHADANELVVAFNDTFSVGGVGMDAPHDPTAPAGEVVNCRCYVELLYPGDSRPDGTTIDQTADTADTEADPVALSRPVSLPDSPNV